MTTMPPNPRKGIRVRFEDFPLIESDLVPTYVAELRVAEKSRDPGQLEAFVDRWRVVFLSKIPRQKDPLALPSPLDKRTFRCLRENRRGTCKHLPLGETCAGMRLILPELLARGSMLAREFHTPENLAIRRLVEVGAKYGGET
jgi:hypothetical protein